MATIGSSFLDVFIAKINSTEVCLLLSDEKRSFVQRKTTLLCFDLQFGRIKIYREFNYMKLKPSQATCVKILADKIMRKKIVVYSQSV